MSTPTSPHPRSIPGNALHDLCYSTVSKIGIFQCADTGWQDQNPDVHFTHFSSITLPSQWASRILGLKLSRHLAFNLTNSLPTQANHILHTATCATTTTSLTAQPLLAQRFNTKSFCTLFTADVLIEPG